MKAQLIVIQGKNEGKTIPLSVPIFKIGRSETCHLRPNSERVSREHAEFTNTPEGLVVRDLGSRNGTLVNGKALTGPCLLKDRDVVQVGPLVFGVAIHDDNAPTAEASAAPPIERFPRSESRSSEASDSWMVLAPDTDRSEGGAPSGDTVMIPAFDVPLTEGEAEDLYERYPEGEGGDSPGKSPRDRAGLSASAEAKRLGAGVSPSAAEIMRKMMAKRPAAK